jgi:Mn2+/Fe2+ NRAMP family transporter
VFAAGFGILCVVTEVFIPYHRYAGYLKFLTLVLLVYVAAALSVDIPWHEVLRSTLLPDLSFDTESLLMVVAIFGTTISPYLFFWQAAQEAEESLLSHRRQLAGQPVAAGGHFRHIAVDTWIGMLVSNVVAFFIIVTTAATLNAHGVTRIESASQAAEALRPIAGDLTFALFAAGIIGTGLLAVPVLAGSAAYAVAEAFGLRGSLELPPSRALGFYGIVSASTLAGAALTISTIDPMSMLFWTAVVNGIIAVPIMIAMMVAVSGRSTKLALPRWIRVLGWLAAGLMTLTVGMLVWSSSA